MIPGEEQPHLTIERVRELLDYDPQTNTLRWRVRLANRVSPGEVTGKQHSVGINGRMFKTSDLIALHTGAVSSLHGRQHRPKRYAVYGALKPLRSGNRYGPLKPWEVADLNYQQWSRRLKKTSPIKQRKADNGL